MKSSPVALGLQHAVADGVSFSAVAGVLENARAGLPGSGGGAVARAVVHHHDLGKFPRAGGQVALDDLECGREAVSLRCTQE